jgi:hypothetical protein
MTEKDEILKNEFEELRSSNSGIANFYDSKRQTQFSSFSNNNNNKFLP